MTNQAIAGARQFYKYATPKTALSVLKSRSFRYSSPLKFNDPFDFQSGLHFDFDIDSLHRKILDRLFVLATSKAEPIVDINDPWGKLVMLVREKYTTHGFPRQRWEEMSAPSFARLIGEIRITQKKYQDYWWKRLLPSIRVFCVSEDRDNLLMWSHYARDHTGVVFELHSLPEEDNPLSVAKPIKYVETPPPFFTEAEWIDDILSIKKMDHRELNRRYAYFKSSHWKYEKE